MSRSDELSANQFRTSLVSYYRNSGILNALKSQLRSRIVRDLQSRKLVSKNKEEENFEETAFKSLVANYLRHHNYDLTLSVFLPETSLSVIHNSLECIRLLELKNVSPESTKPVLEEIVQILKSQSSPEGKVDQKCQTDSVSSVEVANTNLDDQLKNIEREFHESTMQNEMNGSKKVEERLMEFQKRLEKQYQEDLSRKMELYEEKSLSRMRFEESQKYLSQLIMEKEKLETSYLKKINHLREREKTFSETQLSKERELYERDYSHRQKMIEELRTLEEKARRIEKEQSVINVDRTEFVEEKRIVERQRNTLDREIEKMKSLIQKEYATKFVAERENLEQQYKKELQEQSERLLRSQNQLERTVNDQFRSQNQLEKTVGGTHTLEVITKNQTADFSKPQMIREMRDTISNLRAENRSLSRVIDEFKLKQSKTDESKNLVRNYDQNYGQMLSNLDKSKAQVKALKKSNDRLRKRIDMRRKTESGRMNPNEGTLIESELVRLRHELKVERVECKRIVGKVSEEKKRLVEKNIKLKNVVETFRRKNEDLKIELKENQVEVENLQQQLASAKQAISSAFFGTTAGDSQPRPNVQVTVSPVKEYDERLMDLKKKQDSISYQMKTAEKILIEARKEKQIAQEIALNNKVTMHDLQREKKKRDTHRREPVGVFDETIDSGEDFYSERVVNDVPEKDFGMGVETQTIRNKILEGKRRLEKIKKEKAEAEKIRLKEIEEEKMRMELEVEKQKIEEQLKREQIEKENMRKVELEKFKREQEDAQREKLELEQKLKDDENSRKLQELQEENDRLAKEKKEADERSEREKEERERREREENERRIQVEQREEERRRQEEEQKRKDEEKRKKDEEERKRQEEEEEEERKRKEDEDEKKLLEEERQNETLKKNESEDFNAEEKKDSVAVNKKIADAKKRLVDELGLDEEPDPVLSKIDQFGSFFETDVQQMMSDPIIDNFGDRFSDLNDESSPELQSSVRSGVSEIQKLKAQMKKRRESESALIDNSKSIESGKETTDDELDYGIVSDAIAGDENSLLIDEDPFALDVDFGDVGAEFDEEIGNEFNDPMFD